MQHSRQSADPACDLYPYERCPNPPALVLHAGGMHIAVCRDCAMHCVSELWHAVAVLDRRQRLS